MNTGSPFGYPFSLALRKKKFVQKKVRPRFISFLPALLWLIITFILLVLPGSDLPRSPIFDLIYFDKWVHIGMFGILTILWGYPFFKTNFASANLFTIIAVCTILYGVIMEFIQKFFASERSFDLFDILADATGCLIALWWLIRRFKKVKTRNA